MGVAVLFGRVSAVVYVTCASTCSKFTASDGQRVTQHSQYNVRRLPAIQDFASLS